MPGIRSLLKIIQALTLLVGANVALAQDLPPPVAPETILMTSERLAGILAAVDPELENDGPMFRLTVENVTVLVVTDPRADRMRILVPIRKTEEIDAQDLVRMMQANFDTALDARYAIARGTLWAAYIHPLSPLQKDQLLSGLGQTVNLATSYGTLYASGGLAFQGGDSQPLQQKLIENLLKKGQEL